MKWVIDASVAAKWLIAEPGSEAAAALLDDDLAAPDILYAECANVLWKKVRRAEISEAVAESAVRILLAAGLEIVSSDTLVPRALQWANRLAHPVYDCLYLALAEKFGVELVTVDRRLYTRCCRSDVRSSGLRVHLLGQSPPNVERQ